MSSLLLRLGLVLLVCLLQHQHGQTEYTSAYTAGFAEFMETFKATQGTPAQEQGFDFIRLPLTKLPDTIDAATSSQSGTRVSADYTDEVCLQQFRDNGLFTRLKQLQGQLEPQEDHAFRAESVFIFSHSHISVDSTQDAVLPTSQRINAPNTRQYTRFVYRLAYDMSQPGSEPVVYSKQFSMTGSAQQPCSAAGQTCLPGQSCQSMPAVNIELRLAKQMQGQYQLQRLCPQTNQCYSAFSYLPDDRPGGGSFNPCNVGADSGSVCTAATNLLQTNQNLCTPTLVDFNATAADELLYDSCDGQWSDEWSGWSNTLNTACNVACCTSECPTDERGQHMRWEMGPLGEAFNVQRLENIAGSLQLSVSTGGPSHQVLRTASLAQLFPGSRSLSGDQTVRITVNRLFGPLMNLLPDLAGKGIVVYNYTADDSLSTGPTTMVPEEGQPPSIVGLTPTINAWNDSPFYSGTARTVGWVFLNSTDQWGSATGQYGQSQEQLVSSFTGFGAQKSCDSSSLAYYSDYVNLPGWVPQQGRPDSICRITAILNKLSCFYAAAISNGNDVSTTCASLWVAAGSPTWTASCNSLALEGWWYLPYGWDMNRANYWLDGDKLVYDLSHLGETAATPAVAMCRYVTKNGFSSATELFSKQAALVALEVYVDISADEDVAPYGSTTNQAFISTELSSCYYNQSTHTGTVNVAIQNTDPTFSGTFAVTTTCDAGEMFVISPAPVDVEQQVPKNLVMGAPPQTFGVKANPNAPVPTPQFVTVGGTVRPVPPINVPFGLKCTAQLFSENGTPPTRTLSGLRTPISCTVWFNQTEAKIVVEKLKKDVCNWYDLGCKDEKLKDQPVMFWVAVGLVCIIVLGLIITAIVVPIKISRNRKALNRSLVQEQQEQ